MLRRRLPQEVEALGGRPIAFARLDGADRAWLVVYTEHMAVVVGDDVELRHWFEFDGATWRDASRTLTLTFADAAVPAFRLVLAEGESERIALVVRERIEQSIVFQEHAELPSGRAARGMVRRDGEVLFTQVMIDGEPEAADEARLAQLEASLRDVVGLDG